MKNTQKRLSFLLGSLVLSLGLAFASLLPGPVMAEDDNAVLREIEGLKIPPVKPGTTSVEKPFEILKRKDLKEILGKGEAMMALRKSVDFEKQKVLLFRWSGSGKDTLISRVLAKPGEQPKVFFDYTPGLTRDLRFHAKVFALGTEVKWEVVRAKQGVAKAVVAVEVVPKNPVPPQKVQVAPNVRIQQRIVPAPPIIRDGKAGVIRGGLKPGLMPVRGARSMRIYQQWTGFLPNGAPSLALPEKGYVNDEESWIELWNAWRPTEKIPEVNFRNELVLVGALPDKLRVYVRALKTEAGEVTMSVNGSGASKGLSYSFAKVMRAGLISINGQRLPGAPD